MLRLALLLALSLPAVLAAQSQQGWLFGTRSPEPVPHMELDLQAALRAQPGSPGAWRGSAEGGLGHRLCLGLSYEGGLGGGEESLAEAWAKLRILPHRARIEAALLVLGRRDLLAARNTAQGSLILGGSAWDWDLVLQPEFAEAGLGRQRLGLRSPYLGTFARAGLELAWVPMAGEPSYGLAPQLWVDFPGDISLQLACELRRPGLTRAWIQASLQLFPNP